MEKESIESRLEEAMSNSDCCYDNSYCTWKYCSYKDDGLFAECKSELQVRAERIEELEKQAKLLIECAELHREKREEAERKLEYLKEYINDNI